MKNLIFSTSLKQLTPEKQLVTWEEETGCSSCTTACQTPGLDMAYDTCRICLQGQVSANCSMSSPYSYSSRATASAHSPGKDSHVPEGKLLLLLYAFSGLCCKKFGCKEEVFTVRVVRCWHRLPREVVDAPSLEMFKARLDGALGSLVWY